MIKRLALALAFLWSLPALAQQTPFVRTGATVPLSASGTTANAALGTSSPSVWVCNPGTTLAYINFGDSTITATSTAGIPLPAGVCGVLSSGGTTHIAAILASGTATITATPGTGTLAGISGAGSGGGGGAVTVADGADVTQGTTTDAACATDNGTCTVVALVKRLIQRVTTAITALGSPFQAGGSIGNTSFGNRPIGSASSADGITPVVGGSAASSQVLKASPGNLYSVYANCTAACWLMVFNAVSAPSNGATTAGVASGNLVHCVPIIAGGAGGVSVNGMPPDVFTVGITAAISSTACATLTLATTGFINGKVQ